MRPKCHKCREELTEPGALVFGVPRASQPTGIEICAKLHICAACWIKLIDWVNVKIL